MPRGALPSPGSRTTCDEHDGGKEDVDGDDDGDNDDKNDDGDKETRTTRTAETTTEEILSQVQSTLWGGRVAGAQVRGRGGRG